MRGVGTTGPESPRWSLTGVHSGEVSFFPLWSLLGPWNPCLHRCAQEGHGALSQLSCCIPGGFLRDLPPHKAPEPGSQHGSTLRAQQWVPWPFSLLIAVVGSLKSAADEIIILLCLCQPTMSTTQQESQPSWFGVHR